MSYLQKLHSQETGTMDANKKSTSKKKRLLLLRKASNKGIKGKFQKLTTFVHLFARNLASKNTISG